MMRILLILIFLGASSGAARAQAVKSVRQIDFKNFTYAPVCGGDISGEPFAVIPVKDGTINNVREVNGISEVIDEKLPNYFNVEVAGYGDVDGDGIEEAIIESDCGTGGTGVFDEGYVYALKDGKPVLLARIEGGDRAYGGIREITISGGIVTVDRSDPGENGANCCAEIGIKTRYKWNGKTLAAFGKPEKRELYPAIRIKFDKGKSSGAATAKIKGGEFQRFVVGANKGQMMTVKVTPAAGVGLRFGDAETTEKSGFLRAVFKENGDYTFEVSNDGETEIEYIVTVEIK